MSASTLYLDFKGPAARGEGRRADNAYIARLAAFTRKRAEAGTLNLISLFCGGGGLDLGLNFAGFKTRVCSDLSPAFVETVTYNLKHAIGIADDALKLTRAGLLEKADTNEIDLMAAGPPCQSFSILGRRGALDDPRGKLALKYFDLIAEIQPRAFLFENVPGLISVNSGADWKAVLRYAEDKIGYDLHVGRINAAIFGIPQFRERIVLIGFRKKTKFVFPERATGPRSVELNNSFGVYGVPSSHALESVEGLPNHKVRPHGERVRLRYSRIAPGDRDRVDHTDRIDGTLPCGTVLVGSGAGGGRPHIHPVADRVITVREAARLQSFPDWYEFRGTSTAQYRQVGNAVPPLMAFELGRAVKEALERASS